MAYKLNTSNFLALPVNMDAYINRERIVRDTPATCIEGVCFRVIGNELYSESDFLAMYPPVRLKVKDGRTIIGQLINE